MNLIPVQIFDARNKDFSEFENPFMEKRRELFEETFEDDESDTDEASEDRTTAVLGLYRWDESDADTEDEDSDWDAGGCGWAVCATIGFGDQNTIINAAIDFDSVPGGLAPYDCLKVGELSIIQNGVVTRLSPAATRGVLKLFFEEDGVTPRQTIDPATIWTPEEGLRVEPDPNWLPNL